jgi:hypothetical protein
MSDERYIFTLAGAQDRIEELERENAALKAENKLLSINADATIEVLKKAEAERDALYDAIIDGQASTLRDLNAYLDQREQKE